MNRNSVAPADEFNMDTIRIYEHCVSPVFLMQIYMDKAHEKESANYIAMLKRIAKKYSNFLLFSYANATSDFIKERKLNMETIPGAVLTLRDGSLIHYPKGWEFNDENVDKFCELYLRKKLNQSESSTKQPDYTREVYTYLDAVKLLRTETFNSTVLESGKYVLIFFFKSLDDNDE